MIALRRPVREKPAARGAVRVRGKRLGALVRGRRRARVNPLDVLRDVEQQRFVAECIAKPRIGPLSALVTGDVKSRRTPEPVRGDSL